MSREEIPCRDNVCLSKYSCGLDTTTSPPRSAVAAPPADFYRAERYDANDSVGFLMHQVVLSMRRQIEQAMAKHDLTAAQWGPLWVLKRDGPCTVQELARDLDVDTGATTRLVGRLVAKGLVRRQRLPSDRRVVRLSLTPEGEALAAKAPPLLAQLNNQYLSGFSRDEWLTLKAQLRRMLANGQALAEASRGCA